MYNSTWEIIQKEYNSLQNRKYETIFALANGYRGLRGGLELTSTGERGNLIAGIFDKSTAQVTEIVNFQDPLVLNFYVDEEKIDLDKCEVLNYCRTLNMNEGILYADIIVKTLRGKTLSIASERYVSRNNVHRWAAKYTLTPQNFRGKVFVENMIDGTTTNSASDPVNRTKHFKMLKAYDLKPGIALKTKTFDRGIEVIEGTVLTGKAEGGNFLKSRKFGAFGEKVSEVYEIFVEEGLEYVVCKLGATYTSRDDGRDLYGLCRDETLNFLSDGYEAERFLHIQRWRSIWRNIDITIIGDEDAQRGIRFNLFHLASSAYEGDERVSIAAKGLHGEGYKGHVFWDTETFMLPFFIYTMPETARSLLMYRYNTLEGAKQNAALNGFKGAQFPWESADDGLEVTPKWGIGYDGKPIRIWTGDEEYHINSDIAFGIWEYFRATNDREFILKYGLEIFFATARFWQSRVEYNSKLDRYEINRVIGPDEFHEHIDNNVYTNYLAKWSINKTLKIAQQLKNEDKILFERLCNQLGLNEEDFREWKTIQEKIYIPRGSDGRLIEQFEGYFKLVDIEIREHDENGMPIWPDLMGMKLGETQLIKQPDVVMLMLMLGEEFDMEIKKKNYAYYEKRTMHKSSLSPSMYSIMGLVVGDTHNSYKYFMKTIMTDLEDNQGNAEHGLHAASTGGSWQSAVFGFGGFGVDMNEIPGFSPWIPEHWKEMSFNIRWKNAVINIRIGQEEVVVNSTEDMKIRLYEAKYDVKKNEALVLKR